MVARLRRRAVRAATRTRRLILACRPADLAASNTALAALLPADDAPVFSRGAVVLLADADNATARFRVAIIQCTRAQAIAIRDVWRPGAAGRRMDLLPADGTPRVTEDGAEMTLADVLAAAGWKLRRPLATPFP
jgi:hypothetical protein